MCALGEPGLDILLIVVVGAEGVMAGQTIVLQIPVAIRSGLHLGLSINQQHSIFVINWTGMVLNEFNVHCFLPFPSC